MSTAAMPEMIAERSPRLRARIAGLFYLMTFLSGVPVVLINSRLVVPDDAAATATRILAHQPLFWLVVVSNLIMVASYIAVTAFFYDLFKPVDKFLSLFAAFFSLVGCAVVAVSSAFYLAPAIVLRGTQDSAVFRVEQLQALALLFLKLSGQCFNLSLALFGFYCLLIGHLILRSAFLPRILGVLMTFAGLGWLTFLWPPLAKSLSPYILAPGILGEGSLTLWLLVMGVNAQRWREQASAAGMWRPQRALQA